jgi:hypothetical protein
MDHYYQQNLNHQVHQDALINFQALAEELAFFYPHDHSSFYANCFRSIYHSFCLFA